MAQHEVEPDRPLSAEDGPAWAGVFSLAMGVFGLVTAEFLPASLLTPIATRSSQRHSPAKELMKAVAAINKLPI